MDIKKKKVSEGTVVKHNIPKSFLEETGSKINTTDVTVNKNIDITIKEEPLLELNSPMNNSTGGQKYVEEPINPCYMEDIIKINMEDEIEFVPYTEVDPLEVGNGVVLKPYYEESDIDLFFATLLTTVKRFPESVQAQLRLKITRLVAKTEENYFITRRNQKRVKEILKSREKPQEKETITHTNDTTTVPTLFENRSPNRNNVKSSSIPGNPKSIKNQLTNECKSSNVTTDNLRLSEEHNYVEMVNRNQVVNELTGSKRRFLRNVSIQSFRDNIRLKMATKSVSVFERRERLEKGQRPLNCYRIIKVLKPRRDLKQNPPLSAELTKPNRLEDKREISVKKEEIIPILQNTNCKLETDM